MSGSLNRVSLVGNVGADPEVRHTQSGVPVVNLRIATSESWNDKNSGEKKEKTEWHTVVIFGRSDGDSLATTAEKYVRKGSRIMIEGKLQTRKWQAQDGTDRYSTEVVLQGFDSKLLLLDRKEGNRPPPAEGPEEYGSTSTRQSTRQTSQPDMVDDDIPF